MKTEAMIRDRIESLQLAIEISYGSSNIEIYLKALNWVIDE